MIKSIEVVAAVIEYKGKILAFRRGLAKYDYVSNKFEFPGGKVEVGESLDKALERELLEELNLKIQIQDLIDVVEFEYPDFRIKMHCFLVHTDLYDGTLKDHIESAHVSLDDASTLDWIAADKPIIDVLKAKYRHVFS